MENTFTKRTKTDIKEMIEFIPANILKENKLTSNDKVLLSLLIEWCDLSDNCFLSLASISEMLDWKKSTILRARKRLVEKKIIRIVETGNRNGMATVYHLPFLGGNTFNKEVVTPVGKGGNRVVTLTNKGGNTFNKEVVTLSSYNAEIEDVKGGNRVVTLIDKGGNTSGEIGTFEKPLYIAEIEDVNYKSVTPIQYNTNQFNTKQNNSIQNKSNKNNINQNKSIEEKREKIIDNNDIVLREIFGYVLKLEGKINELTDKVDFLIDKINYISSSEKITSSNDDIVIEERKVEIVEDYFDMDSFDKISSIEKVTEEETNSSIDDKTISSNIGDKETNKEITSSTIIEKETSSIDESFNEKGNVDNLINEVTNNKTIKETTSSIDMSTFDEEIIIKTIYGEDSKVKTSSIIDEVENDSIEDIVDMVINEEKEREDNSNDVINNINAPAEARNAPNSFNNSKHDTSLISMKEKPNKEIFDVEIEFQRYLCKYNLMKGKLMDMDLDSFKENYIKMFIYFEKIVDEDNYVKISNMAYDFLMWWADTRTELSTKESKDKFTYTVISRLSDELNNYRSNN